MSILKTRSKKTRRCLFALHLMTISSEYPPDRGKRFFVSTMWLLKAFCMFLWVSGCRCFDCNMTRVYFESRNFYSRLHWDEVKIPGKDVCYSVKYHIYGEKSRLMIGCQNISEPFCDLSSVMTDIRSNYFVKIMFGDLCLGEFTRFSLLEQTSLEYPKLSVMSSRTTLIITLTTPMGPRNRSVKEISCGENCQNSGKSSVNYIVSLTHPESEAGKVFENTSGVITLRNLDVNTEYCGFALYELTHPYIKRQSENTTFCVTMQDKPWVPVILMSALVALFLLVTFALMLCQLHVTRRRKLPKALQVISMNTTPIFNPDPNMKITTMKELTEVPWNTITSELVLSTEPKAVSNAGYAAQDYHDRDWHCHSYANDQITPVSVHPNESYTSYSMVVGVIEPHDREELFTRDSGLGDSISPGLSSCTDEDLFQVLPNAKPQEDMMEPASTDELLVLPVSRGTNGKLHFSGMVFKPLASNLGQKSEIMPLVPELALGAEGALLLTKLFSVNEPLEWRDNESSSNYRKAYIPNGVPQSCMKLPSSETISKFQLSDCTTNYIENWVPQILTDPLPKDRNCILNDNHLYELAEQREDIDESPSELEANILGPWMVQIQG